jgi:RNA polymerase sigma-54 factor
MIRKPRIELGLKHELLPLPLIIQEVTLLEMDILELREAVLAEMTSNPMLDIDKYSDLKMISGKFEDLAQLSEGAEEMWHGGEEEGDRREDLITSGQSPWEKLETQIDAYFENPEDLRIAKRIVENLDAFGYLGTPLSELAKILGVDEEKVERIRRVIVDFEPFGSGCIDFKEFALMQLRERGVHVEPLEVLDFLKANLDFRKKLIPYPFFQEEEEHIRFVVPEIIFRYEEGELKFYLNEKMYPGVQVSRDYLVLLEKGATDSSTLKYLEEKYRRVEKLIENIRKRKEYLRRIGELILNTQIGFLTGKTNKLKPMSQSEGSRTLGIPISTFSRLLKSKYADTPRGIFSLKFFFQKPYGKGMSVVLSMDDLEERLKNVINSENKSKPYSDEEIASLLRLTGIKISRRMVTKLRNKLGIPDSRSRKS